MRLNRQLLSLVLHLKAAGALRRPLRVREIGVQDKETSA
jgi:hypothetical protein